MLWSEQVHRRRQRPRGDPQLRRRELPAPGRRASRTPTPPPSRWPTALGIGAGEVVVCSTGLIGEQLPDGHVLPASTRPLAALSDAGGERRRARDHDHRHRRQAAWSWTVTAGTVGGMAKGAGMLAPGLATMLVVLTTDAVRRRRHELTARCAQRHARDLRPARLRRLHVHQRHRGVDGRPARRASLPTLEDFDRGVTAVCADLAGS